MALGIDTLTFDCADPMRVATFWAEALGFEVEAGTGDADDGVFVLDPTGETRGLFFQPVPEPKVVKNRVHLDVRPTASMAAEVERVQALGASVVRRVDVEGSFWTLMLDPEGNEFCVLRGPEDGWSPPSDE
jgi:predicted enzyme related to lactoylglutathione lyase